MTSILGAAPSTIDPSAIASAVASASAAASAKPTSEPPPAAASAKPASEPPSAASAKPASEPPSVASAEPSNEPPAAGVASSEHSDVDADAPPSRSPTMPDDNDDGGWYEEDEGEGDPNGRDDDYDPNDPSNLEEEEEEEEDDDDDGGNAVMVNIRPSKRTGLVQQLRAFRDKCSLVVAAANPDGHCGFMSVALLQPAKPSRSNPPMSSQIKTLRVAVANIIEKKENRPHLAQLLAGWSLRDGGAERTLLQHAKDQGAPQDQHLGRAQSLDRHVVQPRRRAGARYIQGAGGVHRGRQERNRQQDPATARPSRAQHPPARQGRAAGTAPSPCSSPTRTTTHSSQPRSATRSRSAHAARRTRTRVQWVAGGPIGCPPLAVVGIARAVQEGFLPFLLLGALC